jgi:hypothetical protein
MKKNHHKSSKITTILAAISLVMIVWFCLSYFEIVCKNLSDNPKYSDYNIVINSVNWIDEHLVHDN